MAPSSTCTRKPATNGTVSCPSAAASKPCRATTRTAATTVTVHHRTPAATDQPA